MSIYVLVLTYVASTIMVVFHSGSATWSAVSGAMTNSGNKKCLVCCVWLWTKCAGQHTKNGSIIMLQVENEYNGGQQDYLEWAVDLGNNQTRSEGTYWSLCHDHAACSLANSQGHKAICTINGFWMDEYNTNPATFTKMDGR